MDGVERQASGRRSSVAQFVQICDDQGNLLAGPPGSVTDEHAVSGEPPPGACAPSDPAADGSEPTGDGPAGSEGSTGSTLSNRPNESNESNGSGERDELGAVVVSGGEQVIGQVETVSRDVDTGNRTLTVVASAPAGQLQQVARSVDALRGALAVGLPLLVVAVAAIAWVLVGRALRPVEAIRSEVDEITGTTMHRRVPEPPTGDEIGRLARTMNAMLARLDLTATRQRQFVSDASHELRSPVAAIRTTLEVARHKGDAANWAVVADTALAEEARLEALLDDLLVLATQDENGTAGVRSAPVDLTATAAAEAVRPRPLPVDVTDRANGHGPLVVHGDAGQLTRVVGNLLDNATRHAASTVHVELARDGGNVRLTVDDDGPGIPPDARERVFERFTRLDDGRSRHDGGTGLGLAVVRTIVTRHHGFV